MHTKLICDHLNKLIDARGIDRIGNIIGTPYSLVYHTGYWDSSDSYSIDKGNETIISSKQSIYSFLFFRRIRKLHKIAIEKHELEVIQQRILSDTTKYLSNTANTKEAFDDLETIQSCQKTIQAITDKWRKRNILLSNI